LKPSVNGPTLYEAASVYAQLCRAVPGDAKLQDQYAVRALQLLNQAKSAGYFQEASTVERLKKDEDFDPIRKRADFKAFADSLNKN